MEGRALNALDQVDVHARHAIDQADVQLGVVENRCCPNRYLTITITWVLIQLCVICVVVAGFATQAVDHNSAYIFLGVFVAIMAVFMSVAGTCIMRRYRTPAAHGFLIGISFMMGMIMLMSAVSSGARAATLNEKEGSVTAHAEAALSAFSFLLFVLYLAFAYFAYRWRELILNYGDDEFDTEEYADDHDDGHLTDDEAPAAVGGDVEMATQNGKPIHSAQESDDTTVADV